eukprot:scaffold74610_cov35-Tisochrysis_lutea.AAC.1
MFWPGVQWLTHLGVALKNSRPGYSFATFRQHDVNFSVFHAPERQSVCQQRQRCGWARHRLYITSVAARKCSPQGLV